jgi:hypothetical protein
MCHGRGKIPVVIRISQYHESGDLAGKEHDLVDTVIRNIGQLVNPGRSCARRRGQRGWFSACAAGGRDIFVARKRPGRRLRLGRAELIAESRAAWAGDPTATCRLPARARTNSS